VVPGPAGEAGNQPFPILAGYIFGKNKGERKFAMTAPVTQVAVPVKLEMTAPVTQTAAAGGCLVQFVLPKGVTVASAPHEAACRTALSEGFFFSNRAVLCDGLSARAFAGCVVRRWAAIGR